MSKYIPTLSMESIDSQGKSMLFKELTIAFNAFKVEGSTATNKVKETLLGMEQIIKRYTNITVVLGMEECFSVGAWVFPPKLDKNHPLINDSIRPYYNSSDLKSQLKKKGSLVKGSIDRRKSSVSGVFAELPIKVFFTKGLVFNSKIRLTSEEIAAIIIHEIGHIFTYLEYLGTGITTNYVLQHATKELLDTRESTRKYQILEETEELLDIEISDKDSLTRTEQGTVIQTVIVREVVVKRQSDLGSYNYDLTSFEMLADQFAARHGAGKDIVLGLDKIYKEYKDYSYMSDREFLISEAILGSVLLVTGVASLGLLPILLLFVLDPTQSSYDKTPARMERVRRDTISQLKDKNVSKEYKAELIRQSESIALVTGGLKDRQNFLERFWTSVNPKGRKNYKQTVFQQELETMVNNDLFIHSEKFKQI